MNRINFSPFPNLATDRLILRQLCDGDGDSIFMLRTNESVNEFIVRPKPENVDEARRFIQNINEGISRNRWIYWAICLQGDDALLGTVCLWNFSEDNSIAELGYELLPAFQGKGIMQEALKSIIMYAFEILKFEKLEAFTHKDNDGSTQLLLKNGFTLYHGRIDEGNLNNIAYILKK